LVWPVLLAGSGRAGATGGARASLAMRQARAPTERARVSLSIPRAASARGLHQPWRSHPQPSGRRSSAQLVPGHARLRPDAPLRVDKHCRLRVHRCGALPSGQPWLAGRSPQPPSSTRSCAETPQSAAEKAIASALSNLATQAPVRQLRAAAVRQLKPRDKRPTEPAGGESNPSINGGLPAQIRVELRGFEPLTPWLQTRCSAS
jgi:hypothetical protein